MGVPVWCDHRSDNGGWTTIIKRINNTDHQVNFTREWEDYKQGFGQRTQEYWIGQFTLLFY